MTRTRTPPRMRLALGLLVASLGVVFARAAGDEDRLADPVPIRRVLLPADRLAAELKKAGEGAFRRLDRVDFERLVQDAARGSRRATPPRLAEAKYRAKLIDGSGGWSPGLSGTAQWKVVHPGTGSVLLRLGDGSTGINFAISKPRFDNRDAILTAFPDPDQGKTGTGLALLVDRPGEHTLTMDWSARADPRPEGLVVDLRIPACPAASMELELPVDRALSVLARAGRPDEAESIVSGPHPADAGDRRVWRVACGGRSHLSLSIRRTISTAAPSVVLCWQDTVQKLSPDGVESVTTFSLEALHQGVRDLDFVLDPTLRPTEVTAADLERWDPEPGPGGTNRIHVRLSQPLRKGTVEVRCLAPLGSPPTPRTPGKALLLPWSSPAIQLERAVPRGESLEIWMHPELRLLTWEPGDYRLIDSALVAEAEGKPKRRRLRLQGGGIATGVGGPVRPGGTLQAGNVEYLVTQQLWWRPRADTMELTARLECRVRQGQMFQIPIRLPAKWDVESVELVPAEQLRGWGVRGTPDDQTLLVDLRRPLVPRAEGSAENAGGTVVVRLRPREAGPWTGRDLPFPDVIPIGARQRDGGLAIDFDERLYRGKPQTALPLREAPPAGPPWGDVIPDYYYPFQGDTLRGSIRLTARPPRTRVGVHVEALVLPNLLSVEARIRLEAESGEVSGVILHVSGADAARHDWKWTASEGRPGTPRIRRVSRPIEGDLGTVLGMLGGGVLNRVALAAGGSIGSSWRIEFDRPLRVHEPITLVGRSTRAIDGPAETSIPLISARDAASMAGELKLAVEGAEIVSQTSHGVRETGARAYRWAEPGAWMSVRTRALRGSRPAGATIDHALVTTVLSAQEELRHHVRFRVTGWKNRLLPVGLPPGATLLAAATDGRWLEPTALLDAEGFAQVPVPEGPSACPIELLYTTPAGGFLVGHRLDAPLPDLPVVPVGFRRRWLLPPGVVPLADGRLVRVHGTRAGPNADDSTVSVPGRLLRLLRMGNRDTLGSLGLPGVEFPPADLEQQALSDAFAGLRNERAGQSVRLERVIEDLVGGYLRDRCPFVVDRTALQQAGFTRDSLLTIRKPAAGDRSMPWEDAGLVVVSGPAGAILTTESEARRGPPGPVESGSNSAYLSGADALGRFVPAVEWLSGPALEPDLLEPGGEWDGWSDWVERGGQADEASLWVVRQTSPAAGGVILACLLGLVLIRRQASARWLLLVWLAVFGLGVLWSPLSLIDLAWLPLVAGLVASLSLYLTWAVRQRKPGAPPSVATKKPTLSGASALGAALVFLLAQAGQAQRPQPTTVYLVEATAKGKASVLVPASLLETLEAMARPTNTAEPGPVLLSGEVVGRIVAGRAEFSAVFAAHSFVEDQATLVLPLQGLQLLGDVLVDGARVLPEALAKPVSGYAIRLRGAGRHKVELRFQVVVSAPTGAKDGDAGGKQVSFRLPALPQSRLVFHLPEGVIDAQIPTRLGPSRIVSEGKARRLEADLGAVASPIQIRWNAEGKSSQSRVSVREAHLWDLRADASWLTTFLEYTVRGSPVASLSVAIPDGLEVRTAQARRPMRPGVPADPSVRLSDWRVVGDRSRTLRLEFPGPITGEVAVTLELVPRQAWSRSVLLPIPRPRGVAQERATAYLAYRTKGIDAQKVAWLRLNGIGVDDFAPFWPATSRPPASRIEYASTFAGEAKEAPELRLELRPLGPRITANHSIRMTAGPAQADWRCSVTLAAPDKELSLAQWDIDPAKRLSISGVEGAGVSRWVQSAGRLTVWFEKTTESAKLELSGWVPIDVPATPGKPPAQPRLDLPRLVPIGMASSKTDLRIAGGAGVTLTPTALRDLRLDSTASGILYHATTPDYSGTFLVRLGPALVADLKTTARLEGREVVFETDIQAKTTADLRTLAVRMRDWEGDAWLEVKTGTASRRREQHRRQPGQRERLWSLDLAPDPAGNARLRLTGRAAIEDGMDGLSLPDIDLPGVQTRRVLVVEPSLLVEVGPGMVPLPGAGGGPRSWELRDEATARVVPREQPRQPNVHVLFAEHRSRLADGERWLHEYRCWVRHAGPTEAVVRWPAAVEVVSATVGAIDGPARPVTSSLEKGTLLRLPLPPTGTIHAIVIRFRSTGGETPERPDPRTPSLEGATGGRLLRTIDVPAGWELSGDADHAVQGSTRRALAALSRAAGRLEVCRDTVGQPEFAATYNHSRHRLDRLLRLAELCLNAGGDGSIPLGPERQPLRAWLDRLKKDSSSLPPSPGGEIPPAEPEDGAGRPMSWAGESSETPPRWRLESVRSRATLEAFGFSVQWLAVLLVVAVVSMANFSRTAARRLWPEQLVALGVGCWHLAGPGLPAVALIALGVVGRSAIVIRLVRSLLRRTPVPVTGSSMRTRAK